MSAVTTLAPSMIALPEPFHALGHVNDDWEAAEVIIKAVKARSKNGSTSTEETYRYHLAKLRWYCENVGGVTPSRWTMQDVEHFADFLAEVPWGAIGEGTPFRKQPSKSSQADIRRFVHSLFTSWQKMGYIRLNPMGLAGAGTDRKVNTNRAISLDLFQVVLDTIQATPSVNFVDRQMQYRDLFIFEALRGLGLRASELVGAKMAAFSRLSDPKSKKTYWIFNVSKETGKGGKARSIPVPQAVWKAFTDYRGVFGLPAVPEKEEANPLLLSPYTRPVPLRDSIITDTKARRYFKAFKNIGTRQGLYQIVTTRLEQIALSIEATNPQGAMELRQASPHWLRHTFGKASLLAGHDMRNVAASMGHASLETTMTYTNQEALDLIQAYERANPGTVAVEVST